MTIEERIKRLEKNWKVKITYETEYDYECSIDERYLYVESEDGEEEIMYAFLYDNSPFSFNKRKRIIYVYESHDDKYYDEKMIKEFQKIARLYKKKYVLD